MTAIEFAKIARARGFSRGELIEQIPARLRLGLRFDGSQEIER